MNNTPIAIMARAVSAPRAPDPRPRSVHRPYPASRGWTPTNGGQPIPPAAIGEYLQRLTWQFAGLDDGDRP